MHVFFLSRDGRNFLLEQERTGDMLLIAETLPMERFREEEVPPLSEDITQQNQRNP